MCKIFAITNLQNVKLDSRFMQKVRDLVCEHNRDGFGYALADGENLLTEKILKPEEFFSIHKSSVVNLKLEYPFLEKTVGRAGRLKKDAIAMIAHGRTATSKKSVEACHPFIDDDNDPLQAFVHNGVITMTGDHNYKLKTKNDSELLANIFWYEGLSGLENVNGYYATMNLNFSGRIEFVKDDRASLRCAYVEDIDSYIVATTEHMIDEICKYMVWTTYVVREVEDMVHFSTTPDAIEGYGKITRYVEPTALNKNQEKAFKDYESGIKSNVTEFNKKKEQNLNDVAIEVVKRFNQAKKASAYHNDYETQKKYINKAKDVIPTNVKISSNISNPRNEFV